MCEWYVKNGKLIDDGKWHERINSFSNPKNELVSDESAASEKMRELFLSAVKKRISGKNERMGVLFSGGIDSTLIAFSAKKLGFTPLCFSVGTPGSEDLKWARDVSYALDLPLYAREFSIDGFSEALSDTVKILKTDDAVKASIGAVTYSALKLAKEHGVNTVFSGLGSEEVFAGYERHLKSLKLGDVNAECRAGLHSMYERDIMRDFPLAESLGMRIRTPFLDEDIIRFGMGLSPVLKINNSEKKIIVRKSALLMGIPEKIAGRKKRAAQYGSGFDKILKKLAKKKGFSFRKDYVKDVLKRF